MSKLARLQFVLAIVEFTLIPSFLVIFYTLIKYLYHRQLVYRYYVF